MYMSNNTIYCIIIDKSTILNPIKKFKIRFKDSILKTSTILPFIYEKVSNILILHTDDIKVKDIKDIRRILRENFKDDEYTLTILDKSWIDSINIGKLDQNRIITRMFIGVMKYIEKMNINKCNIIIDLTTTENFIVKYSTYITSRLLKSILNINVEIYDKYFISNDEVNIVKLDVEDSYKVFAFIELLKFVRDNKYLDREDRHWINNILIKIQEIISRLNEGFVFEAVDSYRRLIDLTRFVLSKIKSVDIKNMLDVLMYRCLGVDLRYAEDYSYIMKNFIRTFSEMEYYILNISKFCIMYLVLRLLYECYRYGFIDIDLVSVDNLCNIFEDVKIMKRLVKLLDVSEVSEIFHIVEKYSLCGFYKDLCVKRKCNYEDLCFIECSGSLNVNRCRDLIMKIVDIVDKIDYYSKCELVKNILEKYLNC